MFYHAALYSCFCEIFNIYSWLSKSQKYNSTAVSLVRFIYYTNVACISEDITIIQIGAVFWITHSPPTSVVLSSNLSACIEKEGK